MTGLIAFLLCFLGAFCATKSSPLISKLGNSFRSGEVTATLNNSTNDYDLTASYLTALPSGSVSVILSMQEYWQTFAIDKKIFYNLLENTPSSSTNTNAFFRLTLGYPSLTSKARVRYLAYLTSILSENFNIMVYNISFTKLEAYGTTGF